MLFRHSSLHQFCRNAKKEGVNMAIEQIVCMVTMTT